jgi:hypothetical protein
MKGIQIVPNRKKLWTLDETVILNGRNIEKLSTRMDMFTRSSSTSHFLRSYSDSACPTVTYVDCQIVEF